MEIVGRRWFLMVPWCSAPCPSPSSSSSASQAAPYWTAGGSLSRFHGPGMIQNVWQIDKSPNPIMDGINFLSYLVCFNGKSRILKWRYVSTIFWAIFCSWNGHWFYTSNSLHVSGFLQNDLKENPPVTHQCCTFHNTIPQLLPTSKGTVSSFKPSQVPSQVTTGLDNGVPPTTGWLVTSEKQPTFFPVSYMRWEKYHSSSGN